mmetsp:Transcript_48427/g.123253  ORF Transcript_48427/g.123253 Transcript_48427/m.123253 type:complete len:223 (+) Transcript_48427:57-725(+)
MGQSHAAASITVHPEALEELAKKMGAARVPIELAPQRAAFSGGAAAKEAFRPKEPREPTRLVKSVSSLKAVPVVLHVYDTEVVGVDSKRLSTFSGLPIFHVGVEIYNQEFCFCTEGIVTHKPGHYDAPRHRCALQVGTVEMSHQQVLEQLSTFRKKYAGEHYAIVGFNCQTFALEVCKCLGLNEMCIPPEYVRFAKGFTSAGGRAASASADGGSERPGRIRL